MAIPHYKLLTFNIGPTVIGCIPYITNNNEQVELIANENIAISKTDWDFFEKSWDFKKHPLLSFRSEDETGKLITYYQDEEDHIVDICTTMGKVSIESAFMNWYVFTKTQFSQLKANEEELNRIFIGIYGLQDELTPEVEDKDITICKADVGRDVRSFISYAVGCMFGRYSLDVDGLAYAGGEWDDGKYSNFIPDKDNILPITDEEYFEDDIIGLFCAFMKFW